MNGENRRETLLRMLAEAQAPLAAGKLAKSLSVSRQIIVGDVALLRAQGTDIIATPRGYLLSDKLTGVQERVACRHTREETRKELETLVDQGVEVVDVIVDHAVYGQLTGQLHLRSRYDVAEFMAQSEQAPPLSTLTGGVHLHTLRGESRESLERAKEALRKAGILLEEPEE